MGVVQIKWGNCSMFPGLATVPPSIRPIKPVPRFRPFKGFYPAAATLQQQSLPSAWLLYSHFLIRRLEWFPFSKLNGLYRLMWLRVALNWTCNWGWAWAFGRSPSTSLVSGVMGLLWQAQVKWCWGLKPGFPECQTSMIPTELNHYYLLVIELSFTRTWPLWIHEVWNYLL